MNIDPKALLALFPNLDDIPACDKGMELAKRFLEASGDAVTRIDIEETATLTHNVINNWNEFINHRASCPKCNEE